jgi:hypothetical protein
MAVSIGIVTKSSIKAYQRWRYQRLMDKQLEIKIKIKKLNWNYDLELLTISK